jgi:hypothetical protein
MSFDCYVKQQNLTRPRFDPFHQEDDLRISSYALRYQINVPSFNCSTVYPVQSTTRIQKSGNGWVSNQWRTDTESDLRGINRHSSKVRCDKQLYDPNKNLFTNQRYDNAPDQSMPHVYGRLEDPACTLRCTGVNRWVPLYKNPQETFETPFDHFIPSKLIDKEKYNTHRGNSCWQ